jgi:dGTPase
MTVDADFRRRCWGDEPPRDDDERDDYQRDKARIIHSAAFRRLQAKTQVMGVGEGDFHRTRLTHSIETAQISEGIVGSLRRQYRNGSEVHQWLPTADLIAGASYAHDLGHPPFGHGGEHALHERMAKYGGFEGNGQTLRILTRLEKYIPHKGMNPTRRLLLAVLKYPAVYSKFDENAYQQEPPKCYFDTEKCIVDRLLAAPFEPSEVKTFTEDRDEKDRPKHRSFDCSLMERADDIAYGVHDLEDIVARRLVRRTDLVEKLEVFFKKWGRIVGEGNKAISQQDFENKELFEDSHTRKALIGKLVNLFVTTVKVVDAPGFSHPLLRCRATYDDEPIEELLKALKNVTNDLVVQQAEVQQLERRGRRIVGNLFEELVKEPEKLIHRAAWESLSGTDQKERRVCDYIAGMTDPYAERIYRRLFVPGVGSSRDEL